LFRNQYRILLLGCLIPFALSLYSQVQFASVHEFDLAPVTFGVSGVVFLFAVLRTRLMDVIPVARSRLIENMRDGVLVLDAQHRIVDLNSAMGKLLADRPSNLLGRSALDILSDWVEKSNDLFGNRDTQFEIRIPSAPSRFLDLRVTPLFDKHQQLTGRLMVFRDVTDRKDVEKKLRNANFRLQSQLIEIGILQSQLREQAIRDPLTNLFNRRYLEETLDRELARAMRETYPVCIIMIDIDHFKQINDTHGHEAGDLVLKAVAEALIHHSRRGDFACRYGGEEFIVVMPNITSQVAQERTALLRDSLNSMRVNYRKHSLSATFSMGIATYPANGDSREAILRAADKAMYAAKEAGRDHIRSYDELETVQS
jgi:diguanylate cyclase (GGDEF)-like protein/PAS domain S-box-containing protein